jgi:hypothetical protein
MKKSFVLVIALAIVPVTACGGKVVVDASNSPGAGGAGGAPIVMVSTSDGPPNPTTNGIVSVAVGSTSNAVTVGAGGAPGCGPTYKCAEAITPPDGDPSKLCPGSDSEALYEELLKCICSGSCAMQCGANLCIGDDASASCNQCVFDTAIGCGIEFNDCANDL